MAEDHQLGATQIVVGLSISMAIMMGWTSWFESSSGIILKPEYAYDFIIVGGGTAGSVLASRLSENPDFQVLLIEAGQEEPWISSIPLTSPLLQQSKHDWQFKTEPQDGIMQAFHNQVSFWPRGKVLGGSSQINYNIHTFGFPHIFDSWETKFGATGWNFEEMKKYENKALCMNLRPNLYKTRSSTEQCEDDDSSTVCPSSPKGQNEHRRRKQDAVQCYSPNLRRQQTTSKLSKAFLDAGEELGIPVGNLNDDIDYGFMAPETTVYQGKRWNVATGYLRAVLGKRNNLHVLINTQVTKVVWNGNRAIGIDYIQWGNERLNGSVYARAEVIISAGTVNTPVILTHSGIGPEEVLKKFNIPEKSRLEGVGQNLQDHLSIPLYFTVEAPVTLNVAKLRSLGNIWSYFVHGTGDLAEAAIEGVAAVPINGEQAEVGLILLNMGSVDKGVYSSVANMKPAYLESLFPGMRGDDAEGFLLLATCLHPRSQGVVAVNDSDPTMPPLIQPNYLQHPHDLPCMRDAYRLAHKLSDTSSFRSLGARVSFANVTECNSGSQSPSEMNLMAFKEYMTCIIKTFSITDYHPVGTARMGKEDDPKAVVDHNLKVRGVDNLRVVDASVMPTQAAVAPNSVVITIAEKASDIIKEEWQERIRLKTEDSCESIECEFLILKSTNGVRGRPKPGFIQLPLTFVVSLVWIKIY